MIRTFAVLVAVGLPATAVAQADSTPADSALTRAAGPGSRTIVERRALRSFLADDPQHLLGLVPGVVLRGSETGLAAAGSLSIRGGESGRAAVYIDGAPVRSLIGGGPAVALGLASIANVAVTTGPPDLGLTDSRNGLIEYAARAGGDRLAGTFSARTDEAFDGAGFNRFEGGVGGPLPFPGATWFVGGTLTGQRRHFTGLGSEDVPSYVPAGIDTVVTRVVGGQTQSIALPRFIDHRAYDWGTDLRAHAKIQLATPSGTRVSLTGVVNETQERFFPGVLALAPALYQGARAGARLLVGNWHQPLGSFSGRRLGLRVNASLFTKEEMSGLLTPASELATTDPSLGVTLETLQFMGADVMPFPVTEQIVRNIRVNSGLRVPYLNRDELRNVQTSRANPFGMETSWAEAGLDGSLATKHERRADVRLALDWDAGAGHTVSIAGDLGAAALSKYSSRLLRQSDMDVYRADPNRWGLAVADRLVRGSLRADLTLRVDHFGSTGLFPRVPGRIYSHPQFNRPAAIASDTGYANSLARVMETGRARRAVSFRAAGEQVMGSRTTVRAAVGRWIEPPTLGLVLLGSNADLDFTNTNGPFGRDVDYGWASAAELGARHELKEGRTLDVVLYRRARPAYVFRLLPFDDPANPGEVVNVNTLADPLDRVDYGIDGALDWSVGSWLSARLVYGARLSDTPDAFVSHSAAIATVLRAPEGAWTGLEASLLVQINSGLPYTRLDPSGGTGALALGPVAGFVGAVEPLGSSRLPWTKRLDVRVSKETDWGVLGVTAFIDLRNALSVTNILNLFAETGDVVNATHRDWTLDVEFQNLEREALDNNRLLPNGDIDLQPDCASWTVTGGVNGAVVNCVALRRAEARFGNGDGLYSLAERETTLYAFYNAFHGPQTFYGMGRSVRLGVEIRW